MKLTQRLGTPGVGALLIAGSVATTILLMWATGLADGKNVGVGLAFAGTLLTGGVTFVGLILKDSADRQTAAANDREEARLRVEAAMKAASLVSTASGTPADAATTGAALLALAHLGQPELAVSMLFPLWNENRLKNETAVLIINEAIRSGSVQAQSDACAALLLHAETLAGTDGTRAWYDWPYELDKRWRPDLPEECRSLLLQAWAFMCTRDTVPWDTGCGWLAAGLYACYLTEENGWLRSCAIELLRELRMADETVEFTERVGEKLVHLDATLIDQIPGGPGLPGGHDEFKLMKSWVLGRAGPEKVSTTPLEP